MSALSDRQLICAEAALLDIYQIACEIGAGDDMKLQQFAERIARRILASPHAIRVPPKYFKAPFERELWLDYMNGNLKAAGTDEPVIAVAQMLMVERPRVEVVSR